MRTLPAAVLVVSASLFSCGVSTLEMSDAERALSSSSAPGVTAKDAGPVTPLGEELDAGQPTGGGSGGGGIAQGGGTAQGGGAGEGGGSAQGGGAGAGGGTAQGGGAGEGGGGGAGGGTGGGTPVVCETGNLAPCTTSCGSTGRKTCTNNTWGACVPPGESCDNGSDDDCDGRVDHHDPDCTPIVHTCESADGPGCNGDLGYGDACSAADNDNGCSATRFHAWCNRRNPAYPNIWDNYVHDWVSTRCDGNTDETGTQYSTWYCTSSSNDRYECTTPLVLSFDNAPVRYESTSRLFSFQPGNPVSSDWPAAVTPWLARDVNGNGTIDDGSELFGSNTVTPGGVAKHGFQALAALDANGDGVIDAKDPAFGSLLVWRDANGDRVSQKSELTSLTVERVVSMSLGFSTVPRCDLRGNCERERSTFSWGGGRSGSIVDVYLRVRSSSVALTR